MNAPHAKSTTTRVAVVEDDAVLRDALRNTLVAVPGVAVVGTAENLASALALCSMRPNVFLVDLALPDGSGFELLSHLSRTLPDCKALVLSVFGDVERVVRAIELGADGYLLKGASLEETAKAIEIVAAGGAPLSPAVAAHVLRRVKAAGSLKQARSPLALALTPRELATLEALAKGLSLKEVAAALGISHHTVGDHVKAVYRKLQVSSRGEAVYEAAQQGLIRLAT